MLFGARNFPLKHVPSVTHSSSWFGRCFNIIYVASSRDHSFNFGPGFTEIIRGNNVYMYD
jgi:hypothetical protein